MNRLIVLVAVALVLAGPGTREVRSAPASRRQAIEVGTVRWGRDLEGALAASQRSGKPVFLLLQEVPGCAGCRTFGREVLSHPVIAAVIENEFEPVLVYNNRPGRDAELLERFDEPSWNYQVIRFLDGRGKDIIPRRDRVWTVRAVSTRMVETLKMQEREVPDALMKLTE